MDMVGFIVASILAALVSNEELDNPSKTSLQLAHSPCTKKLKQGSDKSSTKACRIFDNALGY